MRDGSPGADSQDEAVRLRRELELARREAAQWKRTAETSESMSVHSKRVMLRTQEDLKRTISELKRASFEAEQASRAKSRFMAIMSHELRTPLNGIIGSLDCLLRGSLAPDQRDLADVMHQSSTALLEIIDDILDFSKIAAGKMTIESTPFHLPELVRGVVAMFRSSAGSKGLELRYEAGPAACRWVVGDPSRLRQVLANLVGNAIKFTAEGTVEVRLDPGSRPESARFSVGDTGVGIAPDALEKIFDMFLQEDTSTRRRFGGTGLGLAISRQLVDLMGGQIGVESTVGLGSTFHFEIPLPETEEPRARKPTVPDEDRPPSSGSQRFRRVLVVDDNPINRLVAQRILTKLGIESIIAVDGEDAVHRAREASFDLVFMDCSMPRMDGYEATRAIRALPGPVSRVPIVAMTALALAGDREKCLAAGMDEYLSKPIRVRDVEGILDELSARSAPVGA